jgi:hypothetical protein
VTPELYERKAFPVQVKLVTVDNLADIAEWCGGEVLVCPPKYVRNGRNKYVKVPISSSPTMISTERHGMALVGDWVVFGQFGAQGGEGFKVYQPRAFAASFTKVVEGGRVDSTDESEEPSEDACGRTEQTLDQGPCILGEGHLKGPRPIACRSFLDYRCS